jgi:hypothetical protein
MAAQGLGFVEVESVSKESRGAPTQPQKALSRTYHSVPEPIEVDSIQYVTRPDGPVRSTSHAASGTQNPLTPFELESGAVSPVEGNNGVDMVQSFSNPPINRYRLLAVSLLNLGNGLGDSAAGALIPYIEK